MKWFFCLMWGLLLLLLVPQTVYAADLSQVYVRPTRLKASTAPGNILVTAVVGESVSENGVKVTVGDAWTISSTAGNFAVSTSGLPSGVTAWPGIGTASSVAGNVITFPSSSLTVGTKYGFYITGGIATNPSAGDGGDYVWNISTLVGGVSSSSSDVMVSVSDNDQITVTGEVAVLASSFDVDLDSLESTSSFHQDQVIDYRVTYGSSYAQSTTLVVQAEWSRGTLAGAASPSIDVLNYVVGSASDAYGGASPVIDLTNRTITWTIPSFPANTTGKTVTFQLKTNGSYTGSTAVNFTTSARITSPATTADSDVTGQYTYLVTTLSSCGESCASDNDCDTGYCHPTLSVCRNEDYPDNSDCQADSETTETSTATASAEIAPSFSLVAVTGISHDKVSFSVGLTSAAGVTGRYGSSPGKLGQKIVSPVAQINHSLTFAGLSPDTTYYFKFDASDGSFSSDVFSVTTASGVSQVEVKKDTLVVTGNRNLLWDSRRHCDQTQMCRPALAVTKNSKYEINFSVDNYEEVESISLSIDRSDIKGVSTVQALTLDSRYDLIEISPGVFQAQLDAPQLPGQYEVRIVLTDVFGNKESKPLLDMRVVNPILIVNQDGQSVERARVYLYKYDEQTRLFELLRPGSLVEENPLYSDVGGQINISLPHGRYQLQVDALGHDKLTQEFVLTADDGNYPQIILTYQGLGAMGFIEYHSTTLGKVWESLSELMHYLVKSHRFYQTSLLIAMLGFVILLPLSLVAKTRIPFFKLPIHLLHLFSRHLIDISTVGGVVKDDQSNSVLGGVEINVLDAHDQKVLMTTHTDHLGRFQFKVDAEVIKLQLAKKGYVELTQELIAEEINELQPITIKIIKDKKLTQTLKESLIATGVNLLGFCFELILLFSLLFSILFVLSFGWWRTLPLILTSSFNLLFVLFYFSSNQKLKA